MASVLLVSCATKNVNNFQKIQYEAGACFGFCPIFKLTLNPDRTAVIEAQHFTFEEGRSKGDFGKEPEGTFTATLKKSDYNKLISMLNQVNPKSLKSYYGNKNISDLPSAYLTITYKDGTVKKVQDYGKSGTEELDNLWQFFEDLRTTQTWTKVQ